MLKRFRLENFSSFNQRQVLDFTAGSTRELSEHTVDFGKTKLVKSAVIYGANASGKSNLIKAIKFARDLIKGGWDDIDTYKRYFRLNPENKNKPTEFEFEIELDKKFYSYGFSINIQERTIIEEWLYRIDKTNPECIFSRNQQIINLGKSLISDSQSKIRFEIYQQDMRNQTSQLFLTEIANKQLELIQAELFNNLHDWFENRLLIIYPNQKFGGLNIIGDDYIDLFKKYLCKFDTGVVDINLVEEDFDKVFRSAPEELKSNIEKDLMTKPKVMIVIPGLSAYIHTVSKDENGELKVTKLGLVHGKTHQDTFDLRDESDGTKRLLDFIPLINRFAKGHTIVIDEIDRSLHPKLTRAFFELLFETGNKQAQLIATTHESNLLDLDLLRRDEIWFVEKDGNDSSTLMSLNQFKVRYDTKVDKAYLLGRYGAIPKIVDLVDDEVEGGES